MKRVVPVSINEIVGEFRKSPAAVRVGGVLSALALIASGCGDGGNSGISRCPSPEYYRDHTPVKRAEALANMQDGTSVLRNRIRLAGFSGRNVAAQGIPSRLQPAAEAIFPKDEEASVLEDETVLIVGNDNTRTNVDEVEEIVCRANGGEYYPTAEAEEAAADLQIAGINAR